MSLHLMKERVKVSGITPREEMIRDGQNLLKEELEHDSSYSPTMFFYDSDNKVDPDAETVCFNVKPHKIFLFNKETEERIYFEVK